MQIKQKIFKHTDMQIVHFSRPISETFDMKHERLFTPCLQKHSDTWYIFE